MFVQEFANSKQIKSTDFYTVFEKIFKRAQTEKQKVDKKKAG
jgi:hypothetical protein